MGPGQIDGASNGIDTNVGECHMLGRVRDDSRDQSRGTMADNANRAIPGLLVQVNGHESPARKEADRQQGRKPSG
jgi:hypothetical protein